MLYRLSSGFCPAGVGLLNSVRIDGSDHKALRSEEPIVAFTLANSVLVWLTKTGMQAFISILMIL